MGTRLRELFLLLACCACALALSVPANKTRKQDGENFTDQYEYYDADDQEEVLYNEDKPCPRDCLCTVTQGYKIAKCNRLEVGTQKFGDDITDLVIENADPRFPIELDDFIFKKLGLHQVATVKIVNSTIGSVGPHAFHGLRELYAVNLSSNKLKHLQPETFANNKKLLLLTLSNNPLKFPALGSSDYFLNVSSLQELDVSYCKIEYITANTFQNMPSLMYLNVAGNALAEMNPDTFKKLLDLEELDLSDNNIKSLPDDIFSENTELATLHIQRNPIDSVYGLSISDLLTLNAGQTHLKFIGPSMFNGMTYIANLNLSGNSIEKIHNQAFHKLVELNYLDLSYNDLDFISNILIKSNIELDIFKISNNPRLTHLPENGFECSAEQFNIYSFDASNCGLEEVYENSLSTFTALALINLSGNKIKELSPKVFSRSPKLVEINLSHNMLTTLDTKVFEQNHELSKLFLQGNPMKILSAEVFYHTPSLSYLDMSHTELTGLWKEDKNSPATLFRNLSYLNVSHCRITIIKQSELERFNKLSTLDIGNNPLACSREFEDLMTWLSKHNVTPTNNHKIIANMIKDGKEEDATYTWESLSKKVCGTTLTHTVDTSVSDEEIWERIDEDAEGNFDLKNTLDDGKVADDTKTTDNNKLPEPKTDKLEKQRDQEENADDDIDDDEGDDDADGDDDDDEDADDEEDDDDASEDYGDDDLDNNVSLKAKLVGDDKANPKPLDDVKKNKKSFDDDDDELDLKVKLIENPEKKIKSAKQNKRGQTTSSSTTAAPIEDKMKLDIRLLDGEDVYDELELKNEHIEVEERLEYIEDDGLSRYAYLWPILIAMLGALVLLLIVGKVVMIVCSRRTQQMQYNSAIIAAMSQQGRTKKDCGLVYQQLSEELTGPATPKLTRYQPLATVAVNAENISYESSPFHHTNIVPEAV